MKKVISSIAVVTLLGISAHATQLYTKCAACHGEKGEKVSLGKSLVIKDMSKEAFVSAMKGYKDGSYGKEQKALMKPQVATLNDAQIEEIANFIVKQ